MRGFVHRALSKLRGVLGLGLIGSGAGLLGAAFGTLILGLADLGFVIDTGYWAYVMREFAEVAIPWSLLGASIGTGFGALVAVTDAKRSLEELPLWRMGLFGALAGAMFLPAYVLLREGMGPLLDLGMLPFMGVFGAFGAILSSSMVELAQNAPPDALPAADEVVALLEAD